MDKSREEFEAAIFEVAKSKDYQYMNILFDRYENGDYKKTWVDMAWLGWNLNDKRIQQLMAVIELQRNALQFYADGGHWDYNDTLTKETYLNDKGERATEALAIKPQDVELVEVGDLRADDNGTGGIVPSVFIYNEYHCGTMYTIKTKE